MDVIELTNVTKTYTLSKKRPILAKALLKPQKKDKAIALNNVSLKIKKGETIGIIGENGSGKSTLLKIIAGITTPDKGTVNVNGRVCSLLELGAGFHPDLSGKENVYLNGMLLGLTKKEIDERYSEIEKFADIGEYINQPIRTYSSGMAVRLGFSVAIHLDPEILLIDEVLAVGDSAFQEKCMNKLTEMKDKSKTFLIVSHNLGAISLLCDKAICLLNGRIIWYGMPDKVISDYLNISHAHDIKRIKKKNSILKTAKISSIYTVKKGKEVGHVIEIAFEVNSPQEAIGLDCIIKHNDYRFCFAGSAYYSNVRIGKGKKRVNCKIGPLNLAVGRYTIDVNVVKPMQSYIEEYYSLLTFDIKTHIASNLYNHQLLAKMNTGLFVPIQEWSTSQ